jgi:hypothetical protein
MVPHPTLGRHRVLLPIVICGVVLFPWDSTHVQVLPSQPGLFRFVAGLILLDFGGGMPLSFDSRTVQSTPFRVHVVFCHWKHVKPDGA